MKREIRCEPCSVKTRRPPAANPEPGEGLVWISGLLKVSCLCDLCNRKLSPGDKAVAFSFIWNGGYVSWEHQYLDLGI